MKIVTLGTGGCFPNPRRAAPATAVQAADRWILIDAGENVGPRLVESGIPPEELAAVLLTHYHADHTAGLAPLLFGLHVERRRTATLMIGGGPGLGRLRQGLAQAFGDWLLNPAFPLQWTEYDPPGELAFGSELTVRYEEVVHAESHHCLGYRFASAGKVLAVSGDTIACDGLRRLIQQADLLLCEAGYPDDEPVAGHLTPVQIAALANGAGVKKIVLTHFAADRLTERLTAAVQADFAGEVRAARDGEVFVVD
ncbi:MAG: MBL fold metallo-hydrolase [Myxococcales bacterium]|nr:MBL fold metallo-hydrolase [Myxococcales bacterium]